MTIKTAFSPAPRIDNTFLRAIGCLALAAHGLRELREAQAQSPSHRLEGWSAVADELLSASDAVMTGACTHAVVGNSISIVRAGVHVPVGIEYIDRITDRLTQYTRMGLALGAADLDEQRDLVSVAG